MKILAKQRLMALSPISLDKWKSECKKVDPKVHFVQEDGSGKTYGSKGDWTAMVGKDAQADIIGVYSYEGHVAWIMKEPGEFDEYDVRSSVTNPVSDGTAFETFTDGAPPEDETPLVQKLTNDDGTVELPEEQPLLIDDLHYDPNL